MLNKSGVTKTTLTAPKQILANVELQASFGCVVDDTVGVAVGNKKIAKAGTPIKVDLTNLLTPATKGASNDNNAVLLHDVDVTDGDANGTALVFGFVNLNRLDSDVVSAIGTGSTIANKLITFVKC